MDLQLKGKTAFISGSTQGIGFAIAKRLLQEGATVIINGRTQQRIDEAIEKLKQEVSDAQVTGVPADFGKVEEIDALLTQIPEVDILVNNAGIFEPKEFVDITDADWTKFFEVNVLSGVRLSRHYFPKMLAQNSGRIIFISSESGAVVAEEMIHYSTTKTAQLTISRGLAQLTKGTNVTVNSILPGPTKSEGVTEFVNKLAASQNVTPEQAESDFFKTARPASIIQRFAHVDEIANLIAYVASPLSAATNGAALRADGGITRVIV